VAGFHDTSFRNAYFASKQVQTPDGKSDKDSVGLHQPPTCPSCSSSKVWKDGFRHIDQSLVQRWLCRDCGYRFSPSSRSELTNKKENRHTLGYQVCANGKEAKNLVEVETRTEVGQREATADQKGLLFNFAWEMKKAGYAESTIERRTRLLKVLASRGANLQDPESIKETIARQTWENSGKEQAVNAYSTLLPMIGKTWNPPFYRRVQKLPFIPIESEIDEIIAGCSHQISAFIQLLKETAMRAGEAYHVRWIDIDLERGTVTVTPEKGSRPRIFSLTNKTLTMLGRLKRNSKGPFGYGNLDNFRRNYERQRKKLVYKLGNLRLQQITFHTLRHWKATILYHQTKDILYVMKFLGHKSIKNTLVYVQIEEALFNREPEEYICKVADTIEDAKNLIELGFQYICEFDQAKLFRRRK
jgi:integrase